MKPGKRSGFRYLTGVKLAARILDKMETDDQFRTDALNALLDLQRKKANP